MEAKLKTPYIYIYICVCIYGSFSLLNLINILVLEHNIITPNSFILFAQPSSNPLVQPGSLRQLPIGLQEPGLVGHVLEDDVGLVILIVPEANEYDVPCGDPHLLVHLPADVAEPLCAVDARGLAPAVPQHSVHQGVLLPVFFEQQLPFIVVCLVLSSLPVLPSLSLILRHLVACLLCV